MKNRVYIGPANTSDVSRSLQKCLRSVGLNADFIPWSNQQHSFYQKSTVVFKVFQNTSFKIFGKKPLSILNTIFLKPFYFIKSLLIYDTFIFLDGSTFSHSNIDLYILKLFKKKIVIMLLGCYSRSPLFSNNPLYICKLCTNLKFQERNKCNDLLQKKTKVNKLVGYADTVFGVKDLVGYLNRDWMLLKLPVGKINISYKEKDYYGILKILHLPSVPKAKGTDIILPILKRIKKEFDVEVIIKTDNWSREKIVSSLMQGHILIDSLASYTFGKLSLEAIQYGCLPFNAYPDWIAENYKTPPVIKIDSVSIYQVIVDHIKDRSLLKSNMCQSQKVFNEHFTYEAAGRYYKEKLNL